MPYTVEVFFEHPPREFQERILKDAEKNIRTNKLEVEGEEYMAHYYRWFSIDDDINQWLNDNVMRGYWGYQIIDAPVPIHRDRTTSSRFMYLLDCGARTLTRFGGSPRGKKHRDIKWNRINGI